MIPTIVSRDNQQIKTIVALANDSKERKKKKQFVAEGFRTIATLIENGMELAQLYITEDLLARAQELGIDQGQITLVNQFVMDKISSAATPSGIVGVFDMPKPLPHQLLGSGIVLAGITDPGNMGTLIRSAVAMGADSAVCVEGVDVWNPKVVQASAGTISQIKIFQWSWSELLTHKKSHVLYGLIPHGGSEPRSINAQKALLVVGNEAHGIPEQWLASCDSRVTIPMPGNAQSLNAAIAGSIALYLVFGRR